MTTGKSHRHRWIPVWIALCVLGYLAAGKDSVGRTISDSCFLVGIAFLISGLWRLARNTGFFFMPRYGIRRFFAILVNKEWPRMPMGESYQEYLRSFEADGAHRTRLLIAIALLAISAGFALL